MIDLTRTMNRVMRLSDFCIKNPQHTDYLLAELADLIEDVDVLTNNTEIPTRVRLILNTLRVSLEDLIKAL